MHIWRLIDTGALDASHNMAIDESLLDVHLRGLTPPTLRIYRWLRPTLSLGYAQPCHPEEALQCLQLGLDWVRRPTGGRAVLHSDEMTYSVVVSSSYGVQGSILETYRQISQALMMGLQGLGVAADLRPGTQKGGHQRACFASNTQADLGVDGVKLVGSAQLRRGGALLQHGAIPLRKNPALEQFLLGATHSTSLEEVLGGVPAWGTLVAAFKQGFEQRFGITLVSCGLLPCERALAEQRLAKYSLPRLIHASRIQ